MFSSEFSPDFLDGWKTIRLPLGIRELFLTSTYHPNDLLGTIFVYQQQSLARFALRNSNKGNVFTMGKRGNFQNPSENSAQMETFPFPIWNSWQGIQSSPREDVCTWICLKIVVPKIEWFLATIWEATNLRHPDVFCHVRTLLAPKILCDEKMTLFALQGMFAQIDVV